MSTHEMPRPESPGSEDSRGSPMTPESDSDDGIPIDLSSPAAVYAASAATHAASTQKSFARASIAESRLRGGRAGMAMTAVAARDGLGAEKANGKATKERAIETDQKWLSDVDATRHGKILLEHLSHVQGLISSPEAPMQSPVEECCALRRTFFKALADNQNAFNLPKNMPRYVAVVNFCGERLIMYSNEHVLFKLLCHGRDDTDKNAMKRTQAGVREMFAFMDRNKPCSCLLCYSLPFAGGLENLHWELRIFRRHGKGDVRDGTLCFRIDDDLTCGNSTTAACESTDNAGLLKGMVKEMSERLSAVDLDVGSDSAESFDSEANSGVSPSAGPENPNGDKRVEMLEQLCKRLQHERHKATETHRADMQTLQAKHEEAIAVAAASHGETYAQTNATEKLLREQIEKVNGECMILAQAARTDKEKMDAMRAELTAKNCEQEEEIASLKAWIVKLEKRLATAQRKISDVNESSARELKKRDDLHSKLVQGMEKRLATAQLDAIKSRIDAEDYLNKMQTLSKTMDSGDAVKETLGYDIKVLRNRSLLLKCAVMLGGIRFQERTEDLRAARLAHVEADASMKNARKEAKTHKRVAEQATQRAERIGKDYDATRKKMAGLEAELEELKAIQVATSGRPVFTSKVRAPLRERLRASRASSYSPPSIRRCVMRDLVMTTIPITTKAELDLGELQTAHVKMKDEFALQTKEMENLTSKAELELGELQTAHVKLKDEFALQTKEMEHLREELARAKASAPRTATQASSRTDDGDGAVSRATVSRDVAQQQQSRTGNGNGKGEKFESMAASTEKLAQSVDRLTKSISQHFNNPYGGVNPGMSGSMNPGGANGMSHMNGMAHMSPMGAMGAMGGMGGMGGMGTMGGMQQFGTMAAMTYHQM